MSKKPEPPVTIVIPTRNNEGTIREVLQGIKLQTYRNMEVVLVDGTSEDGTVEIASHST